MFSQSQTGLDAMRCATLRMASLLLVLGLFLPFVVNAQLPPGVAGVVTGDDVSVENASGIFPPENSHSIYLTSGSKIVVHSGQGRIELAGGAEIGVCGPAEMTLLESSGAFTLAVNFGRVHFRLDAGTPISVYTPLIVAMPLAIGEGPREAVLGLDTTGSVCVRAMQGGVRLQNQLSGESLIVPQPKEVFLAPGQLQPAPSVRGVCECPIPQARTAAPYVPTAIVPKPSNTPPPNIATANNVPPAEPATPPPASSVSRTETEVSVPAHQNEAPPAPKTPAQNQPPAEPPIWKVMMPPLTFDHNNPAPPPEPSPEAIVLVRETRVEPDWEFHGQVVPKSAAIAPKTVRQETKPGDAGAKPTGKKSGGFRGFFRRLFGRG